MSETDDLNEIFTAGDAWLRKYGIVTPIAHNSIVLNLYSRFPKVKLVEYFMNPEERSLHVIFHIPFWSLLFLSKNNMIDDAIEFLHEYLHDYTITVSLKRHRKGVKDAVDAKHNPGDVSQSSDVIE